MSTGIASRCGKSIMPSSLIRACSVLVAVLILLGGAPRASAQQIKDISVAKGRYVGQVVAVQGPLASPTSLTLQLGLQNLDIRILPRTILTGKSAEADVEGLQVGDYAVVISRRYNRTTAATRVVFDVEPIFPLRAVSGTIARVAIDGQHFQVRSTTGKLAWLHVSKYARIRLDGRPSDVLTSLVKGNTVQVLAQHTDAGWDATDISIRSSVLQRARAYSVR